MKAVSNVPCCILGAASPVGFEALFDLASKASGLLATVVFVSAEGSTGVHKTKGICGHPLWGVRSRSWGWDVDERFQFPVKGVSLSKRSHVGDFKWELASPLKVAFVASGGLSEQAAAEHEMIC
jgi:hypothetical protein